MVNILERTPQAADEWVRINWEEFLNLSCQGEDERSKFYFDHGWMRVEMSPIGSSHGQDNPVISRVVSLYATAKNLRVKEIGNGSFRKSGLQECQPDIAFYIGSEFKFPARSNAPIDVEEFGVPALVIEISATSLADDLGRKRLLYERLGVQEYWVVNVNEGAVVAFEMKDGWSHQIHDSQVLLGLAIATLEEALQRSQTEDDGAINRWLLETFSH